MAEDIRLAVDFFDHPKTSLLVSELGIEAGWCLIRLWCFCARYKPRGLLERMNPKAIETAARWSGEEGKFTETLFRIGFLDRNGNDVLSLHDWEKWNAWSYHKEERSEAAREAADHRWSKSNAKRIRKACKGHTTRNAGSNAPSPNPNPSPLPSPSPIPFLEILNDLNLRIGKRLTATPKHKELIAARWKEGHTLEDFRQVHANMVEAWINDPKMREYLRPVTLYSTKFDGYLNRVGKQPLDGLSEHGRKTLLAGKEWLDESKGQD